MRKKILVILVIVVLVAGGIIGYNAFSGERAADYTDQETFEKFASDEFSVINDGNRGSFQNEPVEKTEFSRYVSTGISYPETGEKLADREIKESIAEAGRKAEKFSDKEFAGKGENSEYEKAAFITGYNAVESEETVSVRLVTEKFEHKKGESLAKTEETNNVVTYVKSSGLPVFMDMIFKTGYKKDLSEFIDKKLQEEYGKELKDSYRKAIDPEKGDFYNFVITEDGAEFIFDSGIITDSEDSVTVDVSKEELPDIFREKMKIRDIDPSKPMVALTFDDGPDGKYTEQIVDTLSENNAVATFYLLGQNVENVKGSDKILKKIVENGSEIGSHSYSHPNLFTLKDSQVKEQNDKTDKAIKAITGETPLTYRPPYGNGDKNTTEIFNKAGLLWSVDTLDWSSKNAKAIEKVIKNSGNLNGQVILMHSIYDFSAKATAEIVPWLKKEGYQLVTVSELLKYRYNQDSSEPVFCGYGYFRSLD